MSRRCCIAICPNAKTGAADRSVSFYPFPADAEQRSRWIDFVGTDPSRFQWRSKYVCSAHFLASVLVSEANGRVTLVEGAVPEIFITEEEKDEGSDILDDDQEAEMLSEAELADEAQGGAIKEEQEIDLRTLFCRICVKKTDQNLVPLDSRLHNIPLVEVIQMVSRLEIVPGAENLPTMVCATCVEKVDVAYNVYMEFNNHSKFLAKLVENKQLENYYKGYDQQKELGEGGNEDNYLSVLIQNFKQEYVITAVDSNPASDAEDPDQEEPPESQIADMSPAAEEAADDYNEMCYEEYLEDGDSEVVEFETKTEEEAPLSPTPAAKRTRRKRTPKNEPSPVDGTRKIRQINLASRGMIPRKINEYRPPAQLIPNTCYVCNIAFESPDALDEHLAEHVQMLPYTCEPCHTEDFPAVFKTLVQLNKHLLSHNYPYKCDFCWYQSPSRFGYKAHMRNMHDSLAGDGYTCDTCGKFFTSNSAFRRHVGKHKALEEERFKCQFCGKLFTLLQLLQRHERIHTGEKPFECKTCGKCFNHEHNFRLHTRRHIDEKPYSCDVCGKSFSYSAGLRTHMSRHFPDAPKHREKKQVVSAIVRGASNTEEKPPTGGGAEPGEYHCDVVGCGFVCYRDKYREIYNHKNKHTRPYACSVCGKTYITNQALKTHFSSVHDDQPPAKIFQCSYCPKWFRDNAKLRQHVNIHEDVRAFKCRFCEKSFVQKVNCTAHERIHTGEQPHGCRYCTARFQSPSHRNKHETRCHPEMVAATEAEAATAMAQAGVMEEGGCSEEVIVGDEIDENVISEHVITEVIA